MVCRQEGAVQRPIIGYHLDAEQHWVADLECGHAQHVRHDPPWVNRPWVLEPAGRRAHLGLLLHCKLCDTPPAEGAACVSTGHINQLAHGR